MSTSEREIQHAVRVAVGKVPGVVLWRNNVGTGERWDEKHAQVRTAHYGLPVGSADLVGIVTKAPRTGLFIALEVKTETGATTPEQRAWIALVSRMGGFARVIRSADEAVRAVEEARDGMVREYDVFVGVSGASNPGRHAIGIVTVCEATGGRNELLELCSAPVTTTPRAWLQGVLRALGRIKARDVRTNVVVRDPGLARMFPCAPGDTRPDATANVDLVREIDRTLEEFADVAITFVRNDTHHPEMERAHALASNALEAPGATMSRVA